METDFGQAVEAGKQDARTWIEKERIDYEPFVALSDMHMGRNTIPVDFDSFAQTVTERDEELRREIDSCCQKRAHAFGEGFSRDGYAAGFVEVLAAVWENIRDEVLKERW